MMPGFQEKVNQDDSRASSASADDGPPVLDLQEGTDEGRPGPPRALLVDGLTRGSSREPVTVTLPEDQEPSYDVSAPRITFFGCHRCSAKSLKISQHGLKLSYVPPGRSTKFKFNISIPLTDMRRVQVMFQGIVSLIRVVTQDDATLKIKSALGLHEEKHTDVPPKNKFFPSKSKAEAVPVNDITMELTNFTEDAKTFSRNLFKSCDNLDFAEVPLASFHKSSNDSSSSKQRISCTEIPKNKSVERKTLPMSRQWPSSHTKYTSFVRMTPGSSQTESLSRRPFSQKVRKESDVIEIVDVQTPTEKDSESEGALLEYPPDGKSDVVTVYNSDLECLKDGEFLNDTILWFYLKYTLRENVTPVIAEQTHLFSSFFYGRLKTNSSSEIVSIERREQDRYDKVKKWTKNLDLFSKDFIVVPINHRYHWFLIIICYPGKILAKNEPEGIVKVLDEEEEHEEALKQPCIIHFDSLESYNGKGKISEPLRCFLKFECKAKKNLVKAFSKEEMPDYRPKIPLQSNSSDCGLFLLQYVESFLKDPKIFLSNLHTQIKNSPNSRPKLENWFQPKDKIADKRGEIRCLIKRLAKDQGRQVQAEVKGGAECDMKMEVEEEDEEEKKSEQDGKESIEVSEVSAKIEKEAEGPTLSTPESPKGSNDFKQESPSSPPASPDSVTPSSPEHVVKVEISCDESQPLRMHEITEQARTPSPRASSYSLNSSDEVLVDEDTPGYPRPHEPHPKKHKRNTCFNLF